MSVVAGDYWNASDTTKKSSLKAFKLAALKWKGIKADLSGDYKLGLKLR